MRSNCVRILTRVTYTPFSSDLNNWKLSRQKTSRLTLALSGPNQLQLYGTRPRHWAKRCDVEPIRTQPGVLKRFNGVLLLEAAGSRASVMREAWERLHDAAGERITHDAFSEPKRGASILRTCCLWFAIPEHEPAGGEAPPTPENSNEAEL